MYLKVPCGTNLVIGGAATWLSRVKPKLPCLAPRLAAPAFRKTCNPRITALLLMMQPQSDIWTKCKVATLLEDAPAKQRQSGCGHGRKVHGSLRHLHLQAI